MHKETYKILHNDYRILPEGYVEIDELIAPTIQVLNRKGYITRYCCSGHSFEDCLELIKTENGSEYQESTIPLTSYIIFEEGITLPVLPCCFVIDPDNPMLEIRKWHYIDNAYDLSQFYERTRSVLETMKQLYQWALDLPDFKK